MLFGCSLEAQPDRAPPFRHGHPGGLKVEPESSTPTTLGLGSDAGAKKSVAANLSEQNALPGFCLCRFWASECLQ